MTSALPTESEAALPLDYDAIYARYLASLVADLRGFRAAAPGLELWVPDEDPLASLRNMLDAAAVVGRQRLAVRLSAKTLGRLGPDPQRLLSMAQAYGDARLSLDGDGGAVLDVSGLGAPASRRAETVPAPSANVPSDPQGSRELAASPRPRLDGAPPVDVGPAERDAAALALYRPALDRAAADPTHQGRSLTGDGRVIARSSASGAELSLAVDASTHRLVGASFDAQEPLQIGLLEQLCRSLSGLPVLEAAEHGTLRLEKLLRGDAPRPVAGIVLADSVHPLFRLARALLAQALADYRRQTGFDAVHSRHDERPGEAWQRASDAERRQWLSRALAAALGARGLEPSRASVESIRYDVRVELSLELPPDADAPLLVMELERALQAQVDPRLEVYVTERRDRNAKRRLAVLEGDT